MKTNRQLFLQHLAQTSPEPFSLEIERAEGVYMYATDGKKHLDLIAGVSVSNVGHRHPKVVEAIKNQVDKYMHLMVYGEYIQSPQVSLATKLVEILPSKVDSVYLVNSGSEAIDGAMKLAKRFTGRSEFIAFKNAYHGGTHGALSLMSDDTFTQAFRPLLPGINFLDYNNIDQLDLISDKIAGVVVESIQGESGIIPAKQEFMTKLRSRCTETGTLLIIDEVQTGFGRTGKFFGYENYGIEPDIVCMAKGMGGGMPIGAFAAPKYIMDCLQANPVLGHITTFGGHPVSCVAAEASLEILAEKGLIEEVSRKGELLLSILKHDEIKSIRGLGLFYSVELESFDKINKFIQLGAELGYATDWFLFCDTRFRIAPPLTITDEELKDGVNKILAGLSQL